MIPNPANMEAEISPRQTGTTQRKGKHVESVLSKKLLLVFNYIKKVKYAMIKDLVYDLKMNHVPVNVSLDFLIKVGLVKVISTPRESIYTLRGENNEHETI